MTPAERDKELALEIVSEIRVGKKHAYDIVAVALANAHAEGLAAMRESAAKIVESWGANFRISAAIRALPIPSAPKE